MRKLRISAGRRALLCTGLAAALAPAAFAHRSQSVFTAVSWNAESSKLEIVHRFHPDDVEIGLARYAGAGEFLDMGQVRNQARLLVYLESHFRLNAAGAEIRLEPVRVEPGGMEIVAYQEAKLAGRPEELEIENQILRDVFAMQTNLVNVRFARRTRTLIFSGRDEAKRVAAPG